nr:spore germination protein [Cohnella faecalis]
MIADSKYSMFPLFASTGRPDYTVNSLLAGRFVLIVDGSPLALIGPAELSLILKSPKTFILITLTYLSPGS